MLFFDLWEPSILWRGRLDAASEKIVEGEVITNKKRFGLFPYTETLATFEADLLAPGKKLPTVILPSFGDQRFAVRFQLKGPFIDPILLFQGKFDAKLTVANFYSITHFKSRRNPYLDTPYYQPPDDFDSPFDMKRYPQFFDPEFVEYFFQSEVT